MLPYHSVNPELGGRVGLGNRLNQAQATYDDCMVDDNDDGDDDGVELGVSKLIDDHPADVFRVGARSVFYGSGHMGRHRPIYESSGLELPFWGCWRPILWEHCANAFVLDNFWTTSGKLSDKLWMTFVCLFPVLLRLKYDNAKIADGYP